MTAPATINFSNNPQSVYNGFMSGMRNMFLLSSVAIAMFGFLKNRNLLFMISAAFIFFFAAYIGINVALDFEHYLKSNEFPKSSYRYEQWKKWKYVCYIYAVFLIILGSTLLFTRIKSVIGK